MVSGPLQNPSQPSARAMGHQGIVWSPDSRGLAFARPAPGMRRPQVVVYDGPGGEAHVVTSDRYESRQPAASQDGRWLFFLSDRNFVATRGSPWGDRNLGPMFDRRTRIHALALQPGDAFPLEPQTELTGENAEADALPAIHCRNRGDALVHIAEVEGEG